VHQEPPVGGIHSDEHGPVAEVLPPHPGTGHDPENTIVLVDHLDGLLGG
jgi:hypothetical protein